MIIGVSGKIGSGKDTVGEVIQYLTGRYDNTISFEAFQHWNEDYKDSEHEIIPNWKIKKYADKLKDIVCILLSCTREQLEDREFKETPLGEEWTRYGYANGFWIHSDNNPSHKMMDNVSCDKETYEAEKRTNWQTAYKRELTPRLLLQLIGTDCGRNIIHPNIWINSTMNSYDYIQKWINVGSKAILPNWIITDVRFPNEADAIKQREGINIRLQRGGDSDIDTKQHESETDLDNYEFDYIIDNNGTIEALIEQVREILIKENII